MDRVDVSHRYARVHRAALYGELVAPCEARFHVNVALLDDVELAIVGIFRKARDLLDVEVTILERARQPIAAAPTYRHTVDRLRELLVDRERQLDRIIRRLSGRTRRSPRR